MAEAAGPLDPSKPSECRRRRVVVLAANVNGRLDYLERTIPNQPRSWCRDKPGRSGQRITDSASRAALRFSWQSTLMPHSTDVELLATSDHVITSADDDPYG